MLFSHKSSSKYCQTSALFFLHCSHYKKRKFWWQVTRTNEGLQSQYLKIQENKIIFHQAKCWRKSISKKANYQWTSTLQEKCDLTQENVKRFNCEWCSHVGWTNGIEFFSLHSRKINCEIFCKIESPKAIITGNCGDSSLTGKPKQTLH